MEKVANSKEILNTQTVGRYSMDEHFIKFPITLNVSLFKFASVWYLVLTVNVTFGPVVSGELL